MAEITSCRKAGLEGKVKHSAEKLGKKQLDTNALSIHPENQVKETEEVEGGNNRKQQVNENKDRLFEKVSKMIKSQIK